MVDFIRKHRIATISILLGALAGFLYWRLIGCSTGTCPITARWYTSTLYGMILGWLVGGFFMPRKNQD